MIAVNERTPNMPRFETVKVPWWRSSGLQRSTLRRIDEPPRVRCDLRERLLVGVEYDGHEQRIVCGNRDADVDAGVVLDLAVHV